MLQNMRDLAKSWVFKSLMILLVVSFGIWGIGDMFRGNPQQRVIAKVGNKKITVQELEHEFQLRMPEARQAFGPELTVQQARQIGVLDRTLNVLIEHSLFDQEAKRLGLNVDNKIVITQLAAQPQFRDKDGKFNTDLWKRALAQAGLSERAFMIEERKNLARRLIFDAAIANTHTPRLVIDNLYQARGQKRILEIITLDHTKMTNIPLPSDKELQDFYQQHTDQFTAPEYRAITIGVLSSENMVKNIAISDDELKGAYESRKAELTNPEQRDLLQVVVQDEGKAKAISSAAKNSKDLIAAAKANGSNAIALDKIDEKTILPELYTTVFALENGQISEPVHSSLGWHIIQVKKTFAGGTPKFEEVKNRLKETLQQEKSGDVLTRMTNKLDDELAAGHALEDIADGMKLRLIKIPALDATGLTPDGKNPEELPAKENVLRTAYEQNGGETSRIIDDGKGNYIIVRTDEVTPSQARPFETVKEKVIAAWKAQEQTKSAATEAEKITKEMRDGKQATFFNAVGISTRLSQPISLLGEVDKEIPQTAYAQILKMKKGDVTTAADPTHHYILRLANLVSIDPAKPESNRIKVVDEMNENLPLDIIEQYSKALRTRLPVSINPELLDTLKKQGSE